MQSTPERERVPHLIIIMVLLQCLEGGSKAEKEVEVADVGGVSNICRVGEQNALLPQHDDVLVTISWK